MDQQKIEYQAKMLAARVKKRFSHLSKLYKKQNITVFRLYDWDIPEIRAVVDWYDGRLVIAEYVRKQSVAEWLPAMAEAVADVLGVNHDNIFLKQRRTGFNNGKRYGKLDDKNKKFVVYERDLKFLINPSDYLDTGLFSDHRNTRLMVAKEAANKDFLNLFCYTGAFSCYAAKYNAKSTKSVDRSETAIDWTRANFKLNNLEGDNKFYQMDTFSFLDRAKAEGFKFDLAVVDPPSYYTYRYKNIKFDISKDHPKLLDKVIEVMRDGSVIYFSTNHQNFQPSFDGLKCSKIIEITNQTIPEDYKTPRKKIHRAWKIFV